MSFFRSFMSFKCAFLARVEFLHRTSRRREVFARHAHQTVERKNSRRSIIIKVVHIMRKLAIADAKFSSISKWLQCIADGMVFSNGISAPNKLHEYIFYHSVIGKICGCAYFFLCRICFGKCAMSEGINEWHGMARWDRMEWNELNR